MYKKIVTPCTIFFFLLSSWSCSIKNKVWIAPDAVTPQENSTDIVAIETISNEIIEFHKIGRGYLKDNEIWGLSGEPQTFEVLKTGNPIVRELPSGQIVKAADGRKMGILRKIKEDKEKVIYEGIPQVRVPLSEIKQVYLRKTNTGMSILASLGVVAGVILGGLGLVAALKESCPFVYSFDGKEFIFDAEPYGGATCQGLQRTEWVELEHLKNDKGIYRVRLTNEVEETQYTDEFKLVVADHDPGVKVAPDENGIMHTFGDPQPPLHAVDQNNRDILPYVAKTDWISWETESDDLANMAGPSTKGELLFEFAKPAGAAMAKVLFNGRNTLWASQMVKRYLELHGQNIASCYAALNRKGMAYEMTKKWNLEEELYQLQIRVETQNGWETRGVFTGGGPFISEDKAYIIDLAGVPGEALRIRLTPPAAFWAINSIAVDYSADNLVQVRYLAAVEALDDSGRDIRAVLNSTDQNYYVMPQKGMRADLAFAVPPRQPGKERTVFAKVGGYYDIHMEALGDPQTTVLSRFLSEPGFAGRYGLDEYLQWKKELEEKNQKK